VTTQSRRAAVTHLRATYPVGDRRACTLVHLARSRWQYRSSRAEDAPLAAALLAKAAERPRWGYRRLATLLRRDGWVVNLKHVLRVYRALGLRLRKRAGRKQVSTVRVPRACRVADAILAYRPVQELASIAALESEARALRSASLTEWASLRRTVLAQCVAADIPRGELQSAVQTLRTSVAIMHEWLAMIASNGSARHHADWLRYYRNDLSTFEAGCDAIMRLFKDASSSGEKPTHVLGNVATTTPAEARRLFDEAGFVNSPRTLSGVIPRVFADVRRFPVEGGASSASRFEEHRHLSRLDRVDLFLALHEAAGANRALAVLEAAAAFLGHVVRDAGRARTLLATCGRGEFALRQTAVVALGLLGETVTQGEGIGDTGDPGDVEAYVLAASLVDRYTGVRAATAAYRCATTAVAREAADSALARLEAGDVLGVIG
jgi:hypothetical protein